MQKSALRKKKPEKEGDVLRNAVRKQKAEKEMETVRAPDNGILQNSLVAFEAFGEAQSVLQLLEFRERIKSDALLNDKVLIKVEASTVTMMDVLIRKNLLHRPVRAPFKMGCDLVGRIIKIGSDCGTEHEIGDKVCAIGLGIGGNSRYVTVSDSKLLPCADDIHPSKVACMIKNYVAAYQCLYRVGGFKIKKKHTVLIIGGAGSFGRAAIQLSIAVGAKVYGTGKGKKAKKVIAGLGAEPLGREPNEWLPRVKENMDIVIDSVCSDGFQSSKQALKPKAGKLICIGTTAVLDKGNGWFGGQPINTRYDVIKASNFMSQTVFYDVFHSFDAKPELFRSDLLKMFKFFRENKIYPDIAYTLPLNEVANTHEDIEEGKLYGTAICFPFGEDKTCKMKFQRRNEGTLKSNYGVMKDGSFIRRSRPTKEDSEEESDDESEAGETTKAEEYGTQDGYGSVSKAEESHAGTNTSQSFTEGHGFNSEAGFTKNEDSEEENQESSGVESSGKQEDNDNEVSFDSRQKGGRNDTSKEGKDESDAPYDGHKQDGQRKPNARDKKPENDRTTNIPRTIGVNATEGYKSIKKSGQRREADSHSNDDNDSEDNEYEKTKSALRRGPSKSYDDYSSEYNDYNDYERPRSALRSKSRERTKPVTPRQSRSKGRYNDHYYSDDSESKKSRNSRSMFGRRKSKDRRRRKSRPHSRSRSRAQYGKDDYNYNGNNRTGRKKKNFFLSLGRSISRRRSRSHRTSRPQHRSPSQRRSSHRSRSRQSRYQDLPSHQRARSQSRDSRIEHVEHPTRDVKRSKVPRSRKQESDKRTERVRVGFKERDDEDDRDERHTRNKKYSDRNGVYTNMKHHGSTRPNKTQPAAISTDRNRSRSRRGNSGNYRDNSQSRRIRRSMSR